MAIKNAFTKENLPYLPLAAVGLTRGVYEEFIKPNPGRVAWGLLITGVVAYDALCPPGQTMSEAVDNALTHHKLATTLAVGATALHLLNVIPERYDALHHLTTLVKG